MENLRELIRTGHVPVGYSDAEVRRAMGRCETCGGEIDNPAHFRPAVVATWRLCSTCAAQLPDPLGDTRALLSY